ncbi:MAG: hypothetical protein EXS51_02340 [Candidatus Taylorbacteria bacterium]|nr:hypothetical protein [Candidatus Taylorbacteria bacterium]
MSRKKTLIIISVALLLIIGVALFFYFWFNREREPVPGGGTFPKTDDNAFPPEDTGKTTVLPDEKQPRLRLLYKEPQAGAVIGKRNGNLVARLVDTALGNVYEVGLAEGTPERLTNTTIPKVYEALWRSSGTGVILRYLQKDEETVETFSTTIREQGAVAGEGELAGSFLPRDITSLAVSPDGTKVFSLREENERSVGIVSDMAGGGRQEVWRSPLREWTARWIKGDTVALLSAPSAFAPGLLLYVNPSTGGVERVLAGLSGFLALPSPTGAFIAFNTSTDKSFTFSLFEKTSRDIRALPFVTLTDKCVWNKTGSVLYCGVPKEIPPGIYPDERYQGLLSFSDELWSVNALTGNVHLLVNPKTEKNIELDAEKLLVSEDESYLIFTDRNTDALWSLRLKD